MSADVHRHRALRRHRRAVHVPGSPGRAGRRPAGDPPARRARRPPPAGSPSWRRSRAAGHHAVAFTQRGYSPGARIDDVAAFTMDKLAGDVLGVADALGIDTLRRGRPRRRRRRGVDPRAASTPTASTTVAIASVPHPAAFADAYRASKDERRRRPARPVRLHAPDRQPAPRADGGRCSCAGDGQVMRAMFAGLPEASVDEYVEVLGTPEGMRGVLDWYRAGALRRKPGSPQRHGRRLPGHRRSRRCTCGPTRTPPSGRPAPTPPSSTSPGPTGSSCSRASATGSPRPAAERFSEELLAHLAAHPAGSPAACRSAGSSGERPGA